MTATWIGRPRRRSWRHPESRTDTWSKDYYRELARILEAGKFDLGFSLTHLLSKAHQLRAYRTFFVQAARRYWEDIKKN